MDDLVCISQQDGLLSPLPFLDVNQVSVHSTFGCVSHRSVLLRKVKLERLELLVAIKVALKVLQKHDFLVD